MWTSSLSHATRHNSKIKNITIEGKFFSKWELGTKDLLKGWSREKREKEETSKFITIEPPNAVDF